MTITVALPAGTRAKALDVVIKRKALKVRRRHFHPWGDLRVVLSVGEMSRSRSRRSRRQSWTASCLQRSSRKIRRGPCVSNADVSRFVRMRSLAETMPSDPLEDDVLTIELEKLSCVPPLRPTHRMLA